MNDRNDSYDVGATADDRDEARPRQPRARAAAAPDPEVRGSFLGFVAHEMRNPLSTALWSAELLARLSPEERAGARGEKLSGMSLRSLQRLRLLVEDHFLAERLEVGGMPLRPEAVPVREAVEAARGKVAGTVHVQVADDLTAWADRGLVDRALEGLLAVASRGGVEATVSARAERGLVSLRIHGAAIPEDALQPPRKGTASDPTGRALSLHMAMHVAAAVGGSLTVVQDDFLLSLPERSEGPAADVP